MKNLKQLRKHKGISQKQLAKIIGVSIQTVFNWENGFFEPNISDLIKLADVFNVTIDYLVGRSDVPNSNNYIRSQLEKIPFEKFLDWVEKQLSEINNKDKK